MKNKNDLNVRKQMDFFNKIDLHESGRGYVVKVFLEGVESVIQAPDANLQELYAEIHHSIEEINVERGYNYAPHDIISITDNALKANAPYDLTAAKLLKDMDNNKFELLRSLDNKLDFIERPNDNGEDDFACSIRGTLLIGYTSWLDEKLPKPRKVLIRYCQYLAMHGYGKASSSILAELDSKNKDDGIVWIKETFNKYIKDDLAVFNYMFGR